MSSAPAGRSALPAVVTCAAVLACGGGYITDAPEEANEAPTLTVLTAPTQAAVNLPVAFRVLAQDPNRSRDLLLDLVIAEFGDGAVDTTLVGGDSAEVSFKHTYPVVGGRTVTFTAQDLAGSTDRETRSITIVQPNPAATP